MHNILLVLLQVYTLMQFAQAQAERIQECSGQLSSFSNAVYSIIESACRDALIQLQQQLETLTVKTEAAEYLGQTSASTPGVITSRTGAGITTRTMNSLAGSKNGDSKTQQQVGH